MDIEIKSLKDIDFSAIIEAFETAFGDYNVQINPTELMAMLRRRGFNRELSFAAFDNNKIVAFTLNGIGVYNKELTAYDTGTGTIKQYQGQGLATRIFEYSIPFLKVAGYNHYLLEVLQNNPKAIRVYRNLGFEINREFNYFVWKNEELINEIKSNVNCQIKQINIDKCTSLSDFWDFYPSWQNSFEAISRANSDFVFLGAFVDDRLIGYSIFAPESGDITQIAVVKGFRRKGVGSVLLNNMCKINKISTMKLLNSDTSCGSILNFLMSKNIGLTGKQFEMIKTL